MTVPCKQRKGPFCMSSTGSEDGSWDFRMSEWPRRSEWDYIKELVALTDRHVLPDRMVRADLYGDERAVMTEDDIR